ncbi:MAG: flagellar export chaperone FliS [Bdellovibrionales bacterium]|nr:flagellar export chaperone FliS [Bdellovibrionales bacterium]
MKQAYNKYKETSVQSASREKILLLLYEGAIRYVKRGVLACENKDIAERGLNIGRAYDIVMELNNTLNHKVGGDISKNLEQLYMFMTDRLTQANISGDKTHLIDVLKILETLYAGWVGAIEKLKESENSKLLNKS